MIGSAGSEEKVKHLLEECGFDAAFNYKTGPVLDQLNRAAHYQAGKLKSLETVVVGIDQAVDAFIGLFDGKNVGKMVVKLSS